MFKMLFDMLPIHCKGVMHELHLPTPPMHFDAGTKKWIGEHDFLVIFENGVKIKELLGSLINGRRVFGSRCNGVSHSLLVERAFCGGNSEIYILARMKDESLAVLHRVNGILKVVSIARIYEDEHDEVYAACFESLVLSRALLTFLLPKVSILSVASFLINVSSTFLVLYT